MTIGAAAESAHNDDVYPGKKSKKLSTMFVIFRESVFVFAVLFTAYATLINTQPKVQRGAPAKPFFEQSDVQDFYQGELTQLMRDVSEQYYAFVMYYAPWDADSQDAKNDFLETSLFYSPKVYFAGVNCWEPAGECRLTFKDSISTFPQLVAYIGPGRAVEYRGPRTADHMIKFLHSVLHPIHRLNSLSDLWQRRALHDAVLVGHLKFFGVVGGLGYDLLFEAALQLASRDHERRRVAVGCFTNLRANQPLGLEGRPMIVLYLWNQRIEYQGKADADALVKWVEAEENRRLLELNSNTLLPHMRNGAVVVMFTPKHPLSAVNPYYQLMRRVAVNFNSCSNGTTEGEDSFFHALLRRGLHPSGYEQAALSAEEAFRGSCNFRSRLRRRVDCNSASPQRWSNLTSSKENRKISFRPLLSEVVVEEVIGDSRRVEEAHLEEMCRLMERTPASLGGAEEAQDESAADTTASQFLTSCETNASFSFVVLDSDGFSHLANGLGLRLPQTRHQTSVVILDNEEVLKLNTTKVTESSVADLMRRYLSGERERPLRSSQDSVNFHNSPKEKQSGETVAVTELNTQTFNSVALNDNQSVVVMYHSPYCSFCLVLSNLFLSLAHLLRRIKGLRFARIDGELNDLPWQFTVPTYPSVLFFPARRKSESRVFPHTLPLNMHSLSSFVVSNIRNYERTSAMLALCSRWGQNPMASSEGEMCLKDVRRNCLDVISQALRDYRAHQFRLSETLPGLDQTHVRARLQSIFSVLEYMRTVHLHLFAITDIESSVVYLETARTRMVQW